MTKPKQPKRYRKIVKYKDFEYKYYGWGALLSTFIFLLGVLPLDIGELTYPITLISIILANLPVSLILLAYQLDDRKVYYEEIK